MPNDKIEEIKELAEFADTWFNNVPEGEPICQDELYTIQDIIGHISYLLQLIEQQQAEIERHNRLQETMKESLSAVISENRKDIEKLQLMLHAVTTEAREHLVALQQSREENARLQSEYERLLVVNESLGSQAERMRGELEQIKAERDEYQNTCELFAKDVREAEYERDKSVQVAKQAGDYAEQRNKWMARAQKAVEERDDYRKVLEWYGGGSEDGGEKARDVILRYKRGDGK